MFFLGGYVFFYLFVLKICVCYMFEDSIYGLLVLGFILELWMFKINEDIVRKFCLLFSR